MILQGKKALVTGGAHRVGKAISLGLAEAGCDLVVHFHRSAKEAEETVAEARNLGVTASHIGADLSKSSGVDVLFEYVDSVFGTLDILVNSAATLDPLDLQQVKQADWDRVIGLNLRAAFFCLQHAAQRMTNGGTIINISDGAARQPWKRYPLHSISKAGLEMLTKVAALALAPEIRVNSVMPGPVLKPHEMPDERWTEIAGAVPMQRAASGEEIAQAVIFMSTNEYIMGETLVVDGGSGLG
jgi:NAD(P)-dependent dehydrogenase (short-subunit alcohol dehydrogenase family)